MMSQPQIPVLPQAGPDSHDRHRHGQHGHGQPSHGQHGHDRRRRIRSPLVERIAGWSARHHKTAVFGWLALVAAAFLGGQALGTQSQPAYDAGQTGQAEQTMHRLGVVVPAVENVPIQARAPGHALAADPAMRQAARPVTSALAALPRAATDIRSPPGAGYSALVSPAGRTALVTFRVPGPAAAQVTAVPPALRAGAAVQAPYPCPRIAEGGD